MGRPPGDSEKFDMRVPRVELADWRRRAAALSISVAELIRLKMRQGDEPIAAPREPTRPLPAGLGEAPLPQRAPLPRLPLSRQQVEPRFKAGAKVKP